MRVRSRPVTAGEIDFTVAWRGAADRVAVVGGPAGWACDCLLEREEGSDRWTRMFRVRRDLRTVYGLLPNPPDDPEFTPQLWYSIEPDPENPKTFVFSGDDEDPEWPDDAVRSILEGPEAPAQPWAAPRPVAAGSVELHRLRSDLLGNERRVYVYTPPGYDGGSGPYPVLLVFDGWAYAHWIPTPTILDNLIAAGRIPPLVAVMPDSIDNETRLRELRYDDGFLEFLADELLPWARTRLRIGDDPTKTVIAGSSAGGLTAAFCAFRRPDLFGNVLSQSGAYGWAREGEDGGEWLTREYERTERLPLRFYLDAGVLEDRALPDTPSILEANRNLQDVLRSKGYEVHYAEFAGAHDYVCWRGTLADGLIALLERES
jgi:enterochelin esterase-like enzyme